MTSRKHPSRRSFGLLASGAGLAVAMPALTGRAQPATVRIATIQPLTGSSASFGVRNRNGSVLAVEEVNADGLSIEGSTFRLELVQGDMVADQKQAVTLFRQYASDGATLCVFGPNSSLGFIPLVPVAGQLECPLIECGAAASIKEWNPWAYRVSPIATTATPAFLKKVIAAEKIKTFGVIYDQMQDGQRADADLVKALSQTMGFQVSAFEAFRTGDQDLSPQIATVRQVNPDAIFIAAAAPEAIRAVNQIREIGMKQPLLTGWGLFQDTVVWDGTKGAVNGSYTWLAQDLQHPSPALKRFIERYRQVYSDEPSTFSVHAANGVWVVADALKKAGAVSRPKIREALASLETTTPLGTAVSFRNPPSGENVSADSIVVVRINDRATYDVI